MRGRGGSPGGFEDRPRGGLTPPASDGLCPCDGVGASIPSGQCRSNEGRQTHKTKAHARTSEARATARLSLGIVRDSASSGRDIERTRVVHCTQGLLDALGGAAPLIERGRRAFPIAPFPIDWPVRGRRSRPWQRKPRGAWSDPAKRRRAAATDHRLLAAAAAAMDGGHAAPSRSKQHGQQQCPHRPAPSRQCQLQPRLDLLVRLDRLYGLGFLAARTFGGCWVLWVCRAIQRAWTR